jgi:hypothetical protein
MELPAPSETANKLRRLQLPQIVIFLNHICHLLASLPWANFPNRNLLKPRRIAFSDSIIGKAEV